jgi:hypothetical protein
MTVHSSCRRVFVGSEGLQRGFAAEVVEGRVAMEEAGWARQSMANNGPSGP